MPKFIEHLGQFTGETVIAPALERMRKKIEQFNLEISGQENLQLLQDKQFLLVANHLMPENALTQQSQLSPDAFVLEKLVHDINNQELKIIAKCDEGWWAENLYKYFQRYISQPFGKGMMQGLDFIPILKNPGSFNKDFFLTLDRVIKEGQNPILIFPEGHWYKDFGLEHKLEPGAAFIAKKYQLPLLPTYIKGAISWRPDTNTQVAFGESFFSAQLSKEEITSQIRLRIKDLQDSLYRKN